MQFELRQAAAFYIVSDTLVVMVSVLCL